MSNDPNNPMRDPLKPTESQLIKRPEPKWEYLIAILESNDTSKLYDALHEVRIFVAVPMTDLEPAFKSGIVSLLINLLSDKLPDNILVY